MIFPECLHDKHKDYPLAPEKIKFKDGVKLCQTLCNKERYVVHSKNLKFYMAHGLKVTKIHRAFKFSKDSFMKGYIEKCIHMRKDSKTDMQKNVWKLMVNAVFGKTMENKRHRQKIDLVNSNDKKLRKLQASPFFSEAYVITKDRLVEVRRKVKSIVFDKPIAVGFTILENSKWWMFHVYYDIIIPSNNQWFARRVH
jgi:hypothetical protein